MGTKIRPFNLHTSVDSHVKGLIDSDYVQARQTAGTDSSSTQAMIDSNFANNITFGGDVILDSAGAVFFDKSAQELKLGDNYKAKFGAGSDLQIYHSGTTSVIAEVGTGALNLITNGADIRLTSNNGSETMGKFIQDGSVELYHDNSKKVETTDSGATVTGNIAADIRSNPKSLSLAHTIDSNSNGLLVGPINVDSGVTLTINGTLMVV